MLETLRNAFKIEDIRKRIGYTFLMLIVIRIGSQLPIPCVNSEVFANWFANQGGDAFSFLDAITGGSFYQMSVFALNITPYITSSIIIQLLTIAIPKLEELQKDGEEGRKKINRYTKMLTIVLALVEGIGIYLSYKSAGIFVDNSFLTGLLVVTGLVAGTSMLMWLGEQITAKGIGNGISLLIFIGIISRLPSGITTLWNLIMTGSGFSTIGLLTAIAIVVGAILLVAGVVFVQQAERRVPVQYSKKVVGRKMVGAQNTHIPLKLAMAGVMPIIFASSFMTFPAMIIQIFVKDIATQTGFWAGVYKFSIATSTSNVPIGYSIANAIVYLLLIVGFTYFYTYATFNPAEISNNIKKNGGFIPGIRAGKPTTEYLSSVISKLTLFGGVFLAIIAILPMLLRFTSLNIAFGGTSILIVVGVALETVQQLESQLVMRHYKGFLEK